MPIVGENNYRNGRGVLEAACPGILDELAAILNDPQNSLNVQAMGTQRNLSRQVQGWFASQGWTREARCFAVPDMRYDLLKENIPVEIELGHQRLVFPDFFKFMADYSRGHIPAAVMIVTGNPRLFGHDWHCSLESTTRKIEAVREVFLVPLVVIGINP